MDAGMTDTTATTLIVFGILAFVAWIVWTLASGVLGITLGEMLLGSMLFALGYAMGRGK